MSFIKKQRYDDSIYFLPIKEFFYIKQGNKYPYYEGYLIKKEEIFGDRKFVDLTHYNIFLLLFDDSDKLCFKAEFEKSDVERGKISYKWKDFDTVNKGKFKVEVSIDYNKPEVIEVKSKTEVEILFVASFYETVYGISEYKIIVDGINLLEGYQLTINANDDENIIAEKLTNAINLQLNHNFTATNEENKITITSNNAEIDNEKEIYFLNDDKIITTKNNLFSGGINGQSAIIENYKLSTNKFKNLIFID